MTFNKDAAIVAQNATGPAAQLCAAIIMANPSHDGGTTTESALALFDTVRTHIFNGSMLLGGVENAVEFLNATPAPRTSGGSKPSSGGGGSRGGNPGEVTFTVGKHKGKTIAEVHAEAPDYLTWCVENMAGKNDFLVGKIKAFLAA